MCYLTYRLLCALNAIKLQRKWDALQSSASHVAIIKFSDLMVFSYWFASEIGRAIPSFVLRERSASMRFFKYKNMEANNE